MANVSLGLFVFSVYQNYMASSVASSALDTDYISNNITSVLNKLVDVKTYDKRLRPNYGGKPVDVEITVYVSSISAVSEVAMDYTLDIYLRQSWNDRRLAFTAAVNDLTIGVDYQQRIWVPDTFFPNEKNSYFHTATTHNSFLRISSNGNVLTSQRLTVTATCPMNLVLFPLDSQECTLEIESYGYSTADISYEWKGDLKKALRMSSEVRLPQFEVVNLFIGRKVEVLATGDYSRLSCRFIFSRLLGFYIIQIYLPSNLIVIISWVSFWITREASPARVALGVTTVLTMTTLMTTTNAAMPKVSYVKTVDVYLGTCFFMVFASLLEYACVVYLGKFLRRRKATVEQNKPPPPQQQQQQQTFQQVSQPSSMTVQPQYTSVPLGASMPPTAYRGLPSSTPTLLTHRVATLPTTQKDVVGSAISSPSCFECEHDYRRQLPTSPTRASTLSTSVPKLLRLPYPPEPPRPQKTQVLRGMTPSSIDKYSRMLFPLFFLCFNCIYWITNVHLRAAHLEQMRNTVDADANYTMVYDVSDG